MASPAPQDDTAGVPMPPPLFFALPLLAAFVLEWLVPTTLGGAALRWGGGALVLAVGVALNLGGYFTQRRHGTDPLPYHPSTAIVSTGPHRYTRNPMYVGFALLALGLALLFDSAWAVLAAPVGLVLVDRFVVVREERYLERKFGETYLAYKRRVRRWI